MLWQSRSLPYTPLELSSTSIGCTSQSKLFIRLSSIYWFLVAIILIGKLRHLYKYMLIPWIYPITLFSILFQACKNDKDCYNFQKCCSHPCLPHKTCQRADIGRRWISTQFAACYFPTLVTKSITNKQKWQHSFIPLSYIYLFHLNEREFYKQIFVRF